MVFHILSHRKNGLGTAWIKKGPVKNMKWFFNFLLYAKRPIKKNKNISFLKWDWEVVAGQA